ncbi:TPA: RluA family pseudouridine synthase [Candidatus Nomurabacteria bacterium]|nr:MAG: Pseudouridine synthase, RluA family [Parcubacteria bacterium RAAC4_OD1_1]HCY26122.1 RluA family pseudouridine synthase [Candidatus Nomurabacteria bacterium]
MNLKILYEDKNILAVDKPALISVHRDVNTRKNEKTLADLVLEYDPKIKKVGEPLITEYKGKNIKIDRPGIVHRLDKETSGVLLVARNQETYLFLKEQFQNHTIKKKYLTFVYGHVKDPKASLLSGKRGVVNAPIGRSPNDIRMWTAGRGAKEPLREAVTEYLVLNRFEDKKGKNLNQDNKFSYLEVYPKTGRTHQIRVHMRYINHPVISDPLYRGGRDLALGMKRLALHSSSISFILPNGEEKNIESPLPADFKKVIKEYL